MKHDIKFRPLIVSILIPLAVGGLSAFLTKDAMKLFGMVKQPPLSPPSWLFPVVWSILYILMGIASYRIWVSDVSISRRDRALRFYAASLAFNFLWPIFFFGMELYLFSFLWLILLWLLVVLCVVLFYYISDAAGKLMIPYLVWLTFAGYLNLGVWLLNR